MKRDWEIIRTILLKLEASESPNTALNADNIEDFPEQEVAYNMRLLEQGGYINAIFSESKTGDGKIHVALARSLNISGHELLDTIRSDTVWGKTKEKFQASGVEMTFDLVIMVGKKIMESLLF